ncbi:uncharacterized protein STEHIDRAFT_144398 [Stereum hirsutum FP-91666 SS1]|uniref:uncharacterized protein n=1 Tax=Stereum hirsutum (strain FP-91666) TaxID=721885 RepID=UPI000440EE1B|nr:uncharacterized protein STEHIDRAFT_144398 [Stereum hirsutum FP-91666 SS1]EIM90890.1 hypothetical protein STEHIDRAFT_144398 [Stereum hirsutum FP-91666 SS1]
MMVCRVHHMLNDLEQDLEVLRALRIPVAFPSNRSVLDTSDTWLWSDLPSSVLELCMPCPRRPR